MRVLVVEDDEKISSFISKGLKQAGFAVDRSANGEDGLFMAMSNPYDVAVIDLMLPGRDGLSLIEELRKKQVATPVLILSARSSVDDKVKGLQTGGDDYLTKPFSFSELLARVQALIRRSSLAVPVNKMQVGDLQIDLLKREVHRGAKLIDLRPREYALLEYLARNTGTVVSKTMILEHI
jgi:DNA-binding response OmpR family regulator